MSVLRRLWPEETEHDRAERVRAMRIAWPVIAAVGVLHLVQWPTAADAAIWIAWTALQAGLSALGRRGDIRRAQVAGTVSNVLPALALAALAAVHDGTYGALLLASLAAVPVIDSLFAVPDAGGPLLAGALALALGLPQAPAHFGGNAWAWALGVAGATALALAQAYARRSRREAEVRAERERGEALEALAESRLARVDAEALESLGVLTDEVAHEVNSPLAAVKASLEFARSAQPPDAGEVADALSDGLVGVERIRAIVSRLQALHRGSAARRYVRPLRAAADEAAGIAASWLAGRAEVRLEVPEGVSALAPWPLVVEMLASLMLQAAHGAREGGAPARIEVGGGVAGDVLSFEVRTSRPPSAITTTAPGHGLATCAEYARRIGGALRIEPAPPAGTRLTLELPVDLGPPEVTPGPRPQDG